MRKILSALLSVILTLGVCLALFSCGNDEEQTNSDYRFEDGIYENVLGSKIEINGDVFSFTSGSGEEKINFNFNYRISEGNIVLNYTGYTYNGNGLDPSYIANAGDYYRSSLGNIYKIDILDKDTFHLDGTDFTKLGIDSFTEKRGTGASVYASERDTSGRNITYVEFQFRYYGRVVVLLDATTAPVTVTNFLNLVNSGFYNGLTIHRVVDDFVIQGGDPNGNGSGGSDNEIKGEFSSNGHNNDISHLRGVISMARSANDPNSASSQFFICSADSPEALDGKYAAFGYVVEGMSVIDKITSATVKYTNSSSGLIYYKELHPVIDYIKVIEY